MISIVSSADTQLTTDRDNPLAAYRLAKLEGDRAALEYSANALVQVYSPRIYRQGLQIWYGRPERHQLADELTQITLIKVCDHAESYHPDKNPDTWIYAIAKNSARDMHRGASALKRLAKPTSDLTELAQEQIGWHSNTSELVALEQICSSETLAEITEEIESLPDHEREILKLIVEDTKYSEIAERLNIPIGTVKSRSNTARKHLAKRLEERGISVLQKKDCA
jgi:RNA polymerase sigma-70 factor (ECF subfamily)